MDSVLEVRDARRSFGNTTALDGASLTVHRAEWVGLLGPNGAGKTTLVRAIAGRVRLESGSISLFGENVGADPDRAAQTRHRMGLVPQDLAIYPKLTARENLEAFARLNGISGSALTERVDWALDFTALADRANDLAGTFSGGMKRRLNIACGVLHQPEIVLLDEPTVGVDPQSRERIWEMLGELKKQGVALVLTTHQLDEAEDVCERIVIIDHGKTIADGSLEALIDQTVGKDRAVLVTLRDAPAGSAQLEGCQIEGRLVRRDLSHVASELPALLAMIASSGCEVEDVRIQPPTLHAVFLHLTGRELRE